MALRAAGDELAVGVASFEDLFRTYAPRVRGVLRARFRGDDARIEDLAQEVFLRAYRSRATLDPTRDAWPWLCTITINIAIDEQRRPQREFSTDLLADRPGPGDPWEHFVASERTAAFKAAMGTLPARGRRLVLLKDGAGYDYAELAEADGTTVQALRCAVLRARRRLRESFSAELVSRGLAALVAPSWLGRIQQRLRRTDELSALSAVAPPSTVAALLVGVAGLLPAAPAVPASFASARLAHAVRPAAVAVAAIPAAVRPVQGAESQVARLALPAPAPRTSPPLLPGLDANAPSTPLGTPHYEPGSGVMPWAMSQPAMAVPDAAPAVVAPLP